MLKGKMYVKAHPCAELVYVGHELMHATSVLHIAILLGLLIATIGVLLAHEG